MAISPWENHPIGSLFSMQLGKMLNKAARETELQYPYLGNREVQWGRFDFTELRRMHFTDSERKKFNLVSGDLLVCEGGEVGRTALWKGDLECYFQKALHRLRPLNGAVHSEFALHFMRFAAKGGLLADFTSLSSIAHLTQEKLALVTMPVPPLPEQRKIAAILTAVDETIEKTEAVIEQLGVVKSAMMQELLTRGLPGRHTRFKKTEIGEVPEEWEVVKLADLVREGTIVTYGIVQAGPEIQGGVPYIRTGDVKPDGIAVGSLRRTSQEIAARFRRSEVEAGDLVYCIRASVGAVAKVPVVKVAT